eukprot:TRINITY_DN6730_c3_g1_i2.p1 TRINITY_DN6730_c3_g1~~TRINITY_DN6730_c3_g1_i2.p1  ORF type:complete len:770 (-),score=166.01 TRINITY_DN6730_c3_g1_i2:186-2495(-)
MVFNSSSTAASDVPCRFLLSRAQAELIVGERNEGVRRVREQSGANVQVLEGKQLPAAFRARDECIAVILADGPSQLRAAITGSLRRAFPAALATRAASGAASGSGLGDGSIPSNGEERQRTVEVMIPEVACRHLVGARGDRIKLLREEAGCDVQLAPGAVAGVAAQKRVRCSGQLSGIEEAIARVHEVLVEFAMIGILHPRHFDLQEVSGVPLARDAAAVSAPAAAAAGKNSRLAVRLLVGKDECGWLIGKRGNKIHKLRELALVSTRDADPELREEGSVVEIFGAPLVKAMCVLQLVVDDLALMRDAPSTSRLVVPADVGQAVFAAEERLAGVRQRSGATVRFVTCGNTWSIVELSGGEPERLLAATAVHELLEQEAAERETLSAGSLSGARGRSIVGAGADRSEQANVGLPGQGGLPGGSGGVGSANEPVSGSISVTSRGSAALDGGVVPLAAADVVQQTSNGMHRQLESHRSVPQPFPPTEMAPTQSKTTNLTGASLTTSVPAQVDFASAVPPVTNPSASGIQPNRTSEDPPLLVEGGCCGAASCATLADSTSCAPAKKILAEEGFQSAGSGASKGGGSARVADVAPAAADDANGHVRTVSFASSMKAPVQALATRDVATDFSPEGVPNSRGCISDELGAGGAPQTTIDMGFRDARDASPSPYPAPCVSAQPWPPPRTPLYSLRLLVPTGAGAYATARERALRLVARESGIARRAGVDLSVELGGLGGADCTAPPVLVIKGHPCSNAVACLLIQKALWLDESLRSA